MMPSSSFIGPLPLNEKDDKNNHNRLTLLLLAIKFIHFFSKNVKFIFLDILTFFFLIFGFIQKDYALFQLYDET